MASFLVQDMVLFEIYTKEIWRGDHKLYEQRYLSLHKENSNGTD